MSLTPQQLAMRRTGIGGSEVAVILGLSSYKTPLQLYREKRGEHEPQPMNEAQRFGHALEPLIRDEYSRRTGRIIRNVGTIRDPAQPWRFATPDGIAERAGADPFRVGFEAKKHRVRGDFGDDGTEQIPAAYYCQVQWYMAITGLPRWDVAALLWGTDLRIYPIRSDAAFQEEITAACRAFWDACHAGTPPRPLSMAEARQRWASDDGGTVEASPELLATVARLRRVRAAQKRLETMRDGLEVQVAEAMGEAQILEHQGKVLATWKEQAGTSRLDAGRLREEHPELADNYTTQGKPSRVLRIRK